MIQCNVYKTSEIPHKWAHAMHESARNPQNNLFFEGDTIYSYRHTWPLAKIYKGKAGVLVLHNSNKYSGTTSTHAAMVSYATNHLTNLAVPYPVIDEDETAHHENFSYFQHEIAKLYDKTKRVHLVHRAKWNHERAHELYEQLKTYLTFFDLTIPIPEFPDFAPLIERAQRIEYPDPVQNAKNYKAKVARDAKKEKDRIAEELANAELFKKQRAQWHNYALNYISYKTGPIMLRLSNEGDKIETSEGASVPLDHSQKLYATILNVMKRQKRYQHNGHSHHIGKFKVDSIEINGTVRIGCHVINFDEIQTLAVQLGWAPNSGSVLVPVTS